MKRERVIKSNRKKFVSEKRYRVYNVYAVLLIDIRIQIANPIGCNNNSIGNEKMLLIAMPIIYFLLFFSFFFLSDLVMQNISKQNQQKCVFVCLDLLRYIKCTYNMREIWLRTGFTVFYINYKLMSHTIVLTWNVLTRSAATFAHMPSYRIWFYLFICRREQPRNRIHFA